MGKKTRIKAVELAAGVMLLADHSRTDFGERLWALSAFFEDYIETGAKGTRRYFGPRKAKVLKLVTK